MSRPSWVEVDLRAVAHNVRQLVRHVGGAALCAVVKADGYGHGAPQVAKAAVANGAAWVAVATVEEGVQLRDEGLDTPVLLLSEPPPDDHKDVIAHQITPTVYSLATIEQLASTALRLGTGYLAVHLKVDTGMHRVGAPLRMLPELVHRVVETGVLRVGGLWSHFSVADTDPEYTTAQVRTYLRAVSHVPSVVTGGWQPPLRHLANTPGALFHPESHLDMVRTGLGIYGLYPRPCAEEVIDLRPVMKIVSHVSHVLRHPAGARPSYGRMRPLADASAVATVPIGYADGVPRLISEGGEVLIGGQRFPLAGRVTMDQLLVEVGDHPVAVGDEAVLVGRQGEQLLSIDDWARLSDTINYEVVSRIGPRLPRRYIS